MTISYQLAPIPKWYIADKTGRPLGGGSMYTYRSLDKTTFKFIYQDIEGNFPWPNPVLFDENGAQGPFYWEIDSTDLTDNYYIEVYDANGLSQWAIDKFAPPGSGGGGGGGTTALDLENLISNNVFWRSTIGSTPVSTSTALKIAPSNHAGFSNNSTNSAGLYTGPDVYFIKNNTSATDTISFQKFNLGTTPFTGDVTPVGYLNYTCSIAGSAETVKCVQFPITVSVQNLSNQNVTLTIWARCSGSASLSLQWYQFFGDGVGASSPVTSVIQTLSLTSSWQKFVVSGTVPNVATKTLGSMGACGNDALFLQVSYPFGVTTNIDFVKPCVYLGNISPDEDYHTYDMIDGVINAQRTGYVMSGFDTSAPPGYIIMNDGSIGSAASLATRANSDTFPLYNLLWNNVNNTWAPVSTGRGSDAVSDYIANKTLTLTRMLGRTLASAGSGSGLSARALGEFVGEETHLLTVPEMPSHTHTISGAQNTSGSPFYPTNLGSNSSQPAPSDAASNTGGGGAHNNMQPTSFMNFFIKL